MRSSSASNSVRLLQFAWKKMLCGGLAATNRSLYNLLVAFKSRTGYGVLCNTSLNFKGKGFINKIDDLLSYVVKHNLDGFVVEGQGYMLKSSTRYQAYLRMPKPIVGPSGSVERPHVGGRDLVQPPTAFGPPR